MILWWLHRLLPKGVPGDMLPLWPGRWAVALLLLGAVYAFVAWQLADPWQPGRYRRAALAALALAGCGLSDWALLAALPRLGLSFGPLTFPLIAMTGIRLAVFTIIVIPVYLRERLRTPSGATSSQVVGWGVKKKMLNAGLVCLWLANLSL